MAHRIIINKKKSKICKPRQWTDGVGGTSSPDETLDKVTADKIGSTSETEGEKFEVYCRILV